MPRLGRVLPAVGILLAVPALTLRAQEVHGVVRDSVSGLAVPGAVVTVLDATGAVSARVLTDQEGRFAVPVPAGPVRLRAIRIGFRPQELPLPAGAQARTRSFEIRMASLPALLTGVHVSGRAICPGSEDRTGALALWDQARAGLLATVVMRKTKPGDMTLLEFVTDEAPDSRLVLHQTLNRVTGSTGRPFLSVKNAADFAQHGYMKRDGPALTFFAPDADVLLDPDFARTHCFRAVEDSEKHPGQVGLGFEPAPGRRPAGFVDVTGTLWMTSTHPALRALEFTFTGLNPAYRRAGIGGILHFRSMPNGLVYIDRWSMDLPAISATAPPRPAFPGAVPPDWQQQPSALRNVHVTQMNVSGGVVVSAAWPDGSYAATRLGTVTGVVEDRAGHPLAGVYASLDGTPVEARTDSVGRFTMAQVLAGKYGLDVVDSLYAPFIDPRKSSRQIDVGTDTVDLGTMRLTSRAAAVGRLCGSRSARDTGTVTVLGTVVGPPPPVGRHVKVVASSMLLRPGDLTPRPSSPQSVTPSDDGRFILCYMVPGARLSLNLVRRDSVVADTTLILGTAGAQAVEWSVHR